MSDILDLQLNEEVTHNTRHLKFSRPSDFEFTPGQAVELTILREGWRDEGRPFTMVNTPDSDTLDFVIKSYPDHDGVTKEIPTLRKGEQVAISGPWGAIHDAGAGTFIAGGAGITPFISILRSRLAREGTLDGVTLIFSNETERDIILREEFEAMEGLNTIFTVTDQDIAGEGVLTERVDRDFLKTHADFAQKPFYICGPKPMISDVESALKDLGVAGEDIITEDLG